MSESLVHFELSADVAVLRMDDGKANALSPEMLDALDHAFDRAEAEATRLCQLSGAAFAATKNALRREKIKFIRDTLEANIREFGG